MSILQSKSDRDISKIDESDLAFRMLSIGTGKREKRFQAVAKRSVLNSIYAHGQSVHDTEVCGVLVGDLYRDALGPVLHIEAAIAGQHAAGQTAQVTFTAETWAHIQSEMEQRYPDKKILGWYHTHPGFGIFLSDMDVFIHENFFGLPWQVAFVYDPHSTEEGLFVWRKGKPDRDALLVEEDDDGQTPVTAPPVLAMNGKGPKPAAMTARAAAASEPPRPSPSATTELADRVHRLEQRQKWMLALIGLLALIAIAWPLLVFLILPGLSDPTLELPPPTTLEKTESAPPPLP